MTGKRRQPTEVRADWSNRVFETYEPRDIQDLIAEFPLAWVCPLRGDPLAATLLPLIGEYDSAGVLTHLVGHLARRNPLYDLLRRNGRGIALFTGPQAYISPRHVGEPSWGPTWNYAQVRVEMDVTVDVSFTARSLEILVHAMEGSQDLPWNPSELGERYERMLQRIAGFRARVTRVLGKFKLGQDEHEIILDRIVANTDDQAMLRWVKRANMHRSNERPNAS